jgi:hydrogenase-1 operon protein HyaF
MSAKHWPISPVGPGSQPGSEDGLELDVLSMPDAMTTYAMPELPEPEQAAALPEAMAALRQVLERLSTKSAREPAASGRVGKLHPPTSNRWATQEPFAHIPIDSDAPGLTELRDTVELIHLDAANRTLVDQTLGEGEVSILAGDGLRIQESVLAGVWRVQRRNGSGHLTEDNIEIGPIPRAVLLQTFDDAQANIEFDDDRLPSGLQNGPSLIAELNTAIEISNSARRPHVINLSLLPHTPEDLLWLGDRLGKGSVTILSRGYGNCRIVSTATRHVWWVQYFNSQDQLILNTLEVSPVPEVACAAREDLEDSRERLDEILRAIE